MKPQLNMGEVAKPFQVSIDPVKDFPDESGVWPAFDDPSKTPMY